MANNKTRLKPKLGATDAIQVPSSPSVNIKNSVGFRLAKILKLKRRFIDLEMKKLGLSRTQWQVLLWMKILGPCSQKELLKNLDIDAAHLARVLEKFEKNNYIVRVPVKDDRRALFIQMTAFSKQQVMPHMDVTLEKENSILVRGLNANDKKYLNKLLQKLQTNMESMLKTKNSQGEEK